MTLALFINATWVFFEEHYLWSSHCKLKGSNMGGDSSSYQKEKARNLLGQNRSFHLQRYKL